MTFLSTIFSIDQIIDRIGVPEAFVEPLKILLSGPDTLSQHVQDPHLLDMIASCYQNSWFEIQGTPGVALSSTGSGPGRPLADLLYNVAMLPVLTKVEDYLHQQELVFSVAQPLPRPFSEAVASRFGACHDIHAMQTAFVDDLAVLCPLGKVPIASPAFLPTVSVLLSGLASIIVSHGMVINDLPGKSGVMFAMMGKGVRFRHACRS